MIPAGTTSHVIDAPVAAPPNEYVIGGMAVAEHTTGVVFEVVVSSSSGFTVITPVISSDAQPLPVVVTVYVYVSTVVMFAVGVPVIVSATGSNVNPTGSPLAVAPVAPPDKLKEIGSVASPSHRVWSKAP